MALQLNTELSWKHFLLASGIPDNESAEYSKILVENRINEVVILDITADHLKAMDITVVGDILSILRHAKTLLPPQTPVPDSTTPSSQVYRPPPAMVKLPNIVSEMTHTQFRKFGIDWDVYKKITNLPISQIGPHIYSACDGNVQTSLINSCPAFFELDETTMLQTIELIVTKHVNPAVHRMYFGNLMQHENESVQDFLTRLRSLAVDCEFLCPECTHDISCINIKDQFIRGLYNETLQTDILAKASQLKTVDDVVKHAEAFEAAIRDQSQLHNLSDAQASRVSDYRKIKNKTFHKQQSCSGCGSYQHGTIGTKPRHSHCPAWGKSCTNCNLPNHTATVCRKPSTTSSLIAHVQYNSNADSFSSPNILQEIPAKVSPDISNIQPVTLDIVELTSAWLEQNNCTDWIYKLHIFVHVTNV